MLSFTRFCCACACSPFAFASFYVLLTSSPLILLFASMISCRWLTVSFHSFAMLMCDSQSSTLFLVPYSLVTCRFSSILLSLATTASRVRSLLGHELAAHLVDLQLQRRVRVLHVALT